MRLQIEFQKLCETASVTTVINFYEKHRAVLDIHYNDDYAFRWAAVNGKLETCKWLYSLDGDDVINLRMYGNFAFLLTAANGHTKVCRWIHDKIDGGIFLYTANNYAFVHASNNNHIETCIFLEKLYLDQNLLHRITQLPEYKSFVEKKKNYQYSLLLVLSQMNRYKMFDPQLITLIREYF